MGRTPSPIHETTMPIAPLSRRALIAGAAGLSGRNVDYLRDLVAHLREMGVRDASMERLLEMVEAQSLP